jgi:hypothetical protein
MEKLGQRGASLTGYASSTDDDRSVREGSISRKTQERWKVGAKKALLQWVQAQVGTGGSRGSDLNNQFLILERSEY